jgi:hypothetical protein
MAVARPRLESCAHTRSKLSFPFISAESWTALNDVDEFILFTMRVTQRRHPGRPNARQIDSKICQDEYVAEWTLLSALHLRRKWFWV